MNPVLRDLQPSAVVRAIEENIFQVFRLFAQVPHAELLDGTDVLRLITGYAFPLANGITRARFAPDHMDAQIDLALEPLLERNLPAQWWIGPNSEPAGLGERLLAHDLQLGSAMPAMAADLNALNRTVARPEDLIIQRVRDADTLRDYITTMLRGFKLEPIAGEFMSDVITADGPGVSSMSRSYIGYVDGKPVGTCTMVLGGGVAGLFNITTVEEARGRGVGTAMTLAALDDALAAGYRVAVLEASGMGKPVYERLGFSEYCKITTYALLP
jgi:ribosomal protein S18 acetylase RimI-like enzyme